MGLEVKFVAVGGLAEAVASLRSCPRLRLCL